MDQRAQISWFVLIALGAGLVAALCLGIVHSSAVLLAAYAVLAVCWLLFPALTVHADDTSLNVSFGIGLVRKQFNLDEIESVKVVQNPRWWHFGGFGVTKLAQGWFIYVGAKDAVEILMRNGTVYRIGTHDPQGLSEFVGSRLSRRQRLATAELA